MTIRVINPRNASEKKQLYRFLYEVWSTEFSRTMKGMDHEYRLLEDDLDQTAQHFMAVDNSGKTLGCIRANSLAECQLANEIQEHFRVTKLTVLFDEDKICYVSHFAVAASARGQTVASLLIKALYQYCLTKGIIIGISHCALHHLSFYYQLGYRPYSENFRIDVGVRVPIIHCSRDKRYLQEISCPLAKICPDQYDDKGSTAQKLTTHFPLFNNPGFAKSKSHHIWANLAHTATPSSTSSDEVLFNGLTEEERRIACKRGSVVNFNQGEYIFRMGEKEQGLGVLLSGSLGIEITIGGNTRIGKVILPGQPFGEIHSLSNGYRTANILAMESCQVLLLPADFLSHVCKADQGLGLKLTYRLLETVASRFVDFAEMAMYAAETAKNRDNPSAEQYNVLEGKREMKNQQESYNYDSLKDQDGEFERLRNQASIGEDIEFSMLEKLGLMDGMDVLDLGSGPGVTSLLMAKRLPNIQVIGIEPEEKLRNKAELLIAAEGCQANCRFFEGVGTRIPLQDNSIDFSYARLLFQHLPNPLEVIAEMKRVTRPGGKIVIVDVDDRSNIIHPSPPGLDLLEQRIAKAQADAGGDRYVGRKLHGYLHGVRLQEIGVEHIPITAESLGREMFYEIVFSFKRQVLERAGVLDDQAEILFKELKDTISRPVTFAMTTVFVGHGIAP